MIITYGRFSQTFGYIEIIARVPAGQGLWSAFWLLSADGAWPPEIDVMEMLGKDVRTYYASTHWNDAATPEHDFKTQLISPGLDLSTGLMRMAASGVSLRSPFT